MIEVFNTPVSKKLFEQRRAQDYEAARLKGQNINNNQRYFNTNYVKWDKYENIIAINKENKKVLIISKSNINKLIQSGYYVDFSSYEITNND